MVSKPNFDVRWIKFRGAMNTIAMEVYSASTSHLEADLFAEEIYREFCSRQINDEAMESWLTERLKYSFLSVGAPPKWIFNEPTWAFLGEKPMIFINQYSLPENEITKNCLFSDVVIYTFGARTPSKYGGEELVIRTIYSSV